MNKKNTLSKRQKEIIIFIKKFIAKNNHSPSIREIANGVNLNSPATVHTHIKNLMNKGYLKRTPNNSLELLVPNEFELEDKDTTTVPIIKNNLEKELKKPIETINIPIQIIPTTKKVFIIKNKNIKENEIIPNDYLLIEKINKPKEKDTLLTLSKTKTMEIKKTNELENDDTVIGRIISLYRTF